MQPGESSLEDTQAMVQQQAGILLDRQRISIEGTHTLTYRHQTLTPKQTSTPNFVYVNLPCYLCVVSQTVTQVSD